MKWIRGIAYKIQLNNLIFLLKNEKLCTAVSLFKILDVGLWSTLQVRLFKIAAYSILGSDTFRNSFPNLNWKRSMHDYYWLFRILEIFLEAQNSYTSLN